MRHLVAQAGGPSPWANAYGAKAPNGRVWSAAQVSQWISETNPKPIGERLARHLEHAQGLHPGALDDGGSTPTLPVSAGEAAGLSPGPDTAAVHLAGLAVRIQRAPPHVRELIGQALLRYAQHPDDAAIARSIEALLGPEESG